MQVDHGEARVVFLCKEIILSSSFFLEYTSWWRGKKVRTQESFPS